ncbi:MAG: family 43 glycosylhydrolase, partial [Opitutales bacterium]|nr:family 43 glycosylhydrolase [Opitutales bacterium]
MLTFCNPINISYQPFNKNARSAADPVVVPFKGKYYLFGSLYKGGTLGYWASEDLVKWKLIPFPDSILGEILNKDGEAYAPGLVAIDGFIYYARLDGSVAIRTSNPDNPDSWELFSKKAFAGFDPAYFLDDDGKLYNYSGALESNVVQLDKSDFSAMGKTRKQLTPKTKTAEVLSRQSYGLYW